MFKMIVVDLDGTLLNQEGTISKKTEEYLKGLKNKGYIITIATGRIYSSILKATRGAEFANYLISDTGACTYRENCNTPLFQNAIQKEEVLKIITYYNDDFDFIDICNQNQFYKYNPKKNSIDEIFKQGKFISHVAMMMKSNSAVLSLFEILKKDLPQLEIIIMQDSFGEKKWIEILPKHCSKEKAIADLIDFIGIKKEEIIAFGDGLNDRGMLSFCGHGVAMKNALEVVKRSADAVTEEDYSHDGVIHYLKSFLKD